MSGADLEHRTKAALKQFDSNMSGIFDRASFYDSELYSQAAYPQLTRAQLCFKYTLFAANIVFLIFGCVLIAVGSYATTNSIGALSGNTLPVGIVVLGVFILLLSLLGGVSAYKESRLFLLVYFLFLLLLTLVLFFVGIAVYVERNNAATYITQGWQTATPALRSSLQSIFQCCGCCTPQYVQSNDTAYPCSLPPGAQQGCLPVFVSYFQSYYVTAGGCGIAFAVIMFVGMLIVCFLMQGIKAKRAEQDLAKLRANNNTDDADIQLAMGAAAAQTGGGQAQDRRRRQQQAAGAADDDDDEEEEDEEEVEEEDETDDGR